MDRYSKLIIASAIAISSQSANAIIIDFKYDYDNSGFFSGVNESRRDVLNAAGSFFETRLSDSLTAITSAGTNHFNVKFTSPIDFNEEITINDYSVATDTIVVYIGAQELPGSSLGLGGPGGYGASSFQQTFLDNLDTRGQGPESSDFGPWGGAISFDADSIWYFDPDVSTIDDELSGKNDFYSVALHELGHILGYGTSDTWANHYPGIDHWAEGKTSFVNGESQEAAMDPTLTVGTRKYFTDLDMQGLTDIGWEVTAVPVPAAVYLFGSALIGLAGFRRKA